MLPVGITRGRMVGWRLVGLYAVLLAGCAAFWVAVARAAYLWWVP